jgi:Glucanosyltransferase
MCHFRISVILALVMDLLPLTPPPLPVLLPNEIISRVIVQGRYLIDETSGRRFRMRGIAFPISPLSSYDAEGWIAILEQLRAASSLLNTIRLYHLDIDAHDYTEFFERARQLGFYLLVPLTTDGGGGVLNRNAVAPYCYSSALYDHGRRIIDMTWSQFPNILAGVLGNEVMNSIPSWNAAPCILAFARDLKYHQPNIPLIYTMQHDGMGATITASQAVQLTLEYLTSCGSHVDILGINIESWCSSRQTFELNEDGSTGSYLDLYEHLRNSSIPLVFSEDGCSMDLFNRDNGLERYARDWKQIPVVETDMEDVMSGFIAYAYDGPPGFCMTQGGPWDGIHTLPFAKDMEYFLHQLNQSSFHDQKNQSLVINNTKSEKAEDFDLYSALSQDSKTLLPNLLSYTCNSTQVALKSCCDLNLMDLDDIPSYYSPHEIPLNGTVHEKDPTKPTSTTPLDNNHSIGYSVGLCIFVIMIMLIYRLLPKISNKVKAWQRQKVSTPITSNLSTANGNVGRNVARQYHTFSTSDTST